jgi:hypothetical protein
MSTVKKKSVGHYTAIPDLPCPAEEKDLLLEFWLQQGILHQIQLRTGKDQNTTYVVGETQHDFRSSIPPRGNV